MDGGFHKWKYGVAPLADGVALSSQYKQYRTVHSVHSQCFALSFRRFRSHALSRESPPLTGCTDNMLARSQQWRSLGAANHWPHAPGFYSWHFAPSRTLCCKRLPGVCMISSSSGRDIRSSNKTFPLTPATTLGKAGLGWAGLVSARLRCSKQVAFGFMPRFFCPLQNLLNL